MNVAFHALAALAIGQTAACRAATATRPGARAAIAVVAFVLGVMSHGVLDGLPHEYPFRALGDTLTSLALVTTWMAITRPGYRMLPIIALAGALLPDVIDHVPEDLNRHLGTHFPVLPNLFPWHHRGGSGSLSGAVPRDARIASIANHVIVVVYCGAMLWLSRRALRTRG